MKTTGWNRHAARRGYGLGVAWFGVVLWLLAGIAHAGPESVVFDGYFERSDDDGRIAQLSGSSQYIRFYPGHRIIRLYVPHPYPGNLTADVLRRVFHQAHGSTIGSAFIRSDFGELEKAVVAHLDVVRVIADRILFDCSNSAPCEVLFSRDGMVIVNPGIVGDHHIEYHLVPDSWADAD